MTRLANDEPDRVVRVPPVTRIRPAPVTVSDAVPPVKFSSAPALRLIDPAATPPPTMVTAPGPLAEPATAENGTRMVPLLVAVAARVPVLVLIMVPAVAQL